MHACNQSAPAERKEFGRLSIRKAAKRDSTAIRRWDDPTWRYPIINGTNRRVLGIQRWGMGGTIKQGTSTYRRPIYLRSRYILYGLFFPSKLSHTSRRRHIACIPARSLGLVGDADGMASSKMSCLTPHTDTHTVRITFSHPRPGSVIVIRDTEFTT